ncbi:TauD/TfdA family dioxygenase [Lentibacter algarum]|uniref:TauD/TfdA dioxygenase family protein n=1 Tax=Lentibacter algarum TaxID=576131 RepID=UPI001C0772F0|nr:TauD/TfdA family dioxygenase [Lentibacter algarum]MBU2981510.1 TauD/TfdA family dioxygenase [Lentibacter algarum]
MKTSALHPDFGLVVHDVDLNSVTDETFPGIRAAFEQHSALLFPKQSMDDATHTRLAEMFGPLENRAAMAAGRDVEFEVSDVSNETETGVLDAAIAHCTRPEAVYSHQWQVGDVLIWDERAVLHRGRPWDYSEPRSLKSICCSVPENDGLKAVKIV